VRRRRRHSHEPGEVVQMVLIYRACSYSMCGVSCPLAVAMPFLLAVGVSTASAAHEHALQGTALALTRTIFAQILDSDQPSCKSGQKKWGLRCRWTLPSRLCLRAEWALVCCDSAKDAIFLCVHHYKKVSESCILPQCSCDESPFDGVRTSATKARSVVC